MWVNCNSHIYPIPSKIIKIQALKKNILVKYRFFPKSGLNFPLMI